LAGGPQLAVSGSPFAVDGKLLAVNLHRSACRAVLLVAWFACAATLVAQPGKLTYSSAGNGSNLHVAAELLNLLPGVHVRSGLTEREIAILTELRLPRVVLGLLVGGMLALAGGAYQGVFRNPLADPQLIGVAAGAGLGVTTVISLRPGDAGGDATANLPLGVPVAAFAGALLAVAMTWLLGATGGRDRSPATLITRSELAKQSSRRLIINPTSPFRA